MDLNDHTQMDETQRLAFIRDNIPELRDTLQESMRQQHAYSEHVSAAVKKWKAHTQETLDLFDKQVADMEQPMRDFKEQDFKRLFDLLSSLEYVTNFVNEHRSVTSYAQEPLTEGERKVLETGKILGYPTPTLQSMQALCPRIMTEVTTYTHQNLDKVLDVVYATDE